jgi:hypothetical protein
MFFQKNYKRHKYERKAWFNFVSQQIYNKFETINSFNFIINFNVTLRF